MRDDWIIDVLADLKSFSRQNGLEAIAEQLDDTMLVAAAEIASQQKGTPSAREDAEQTGDSYRAHAQCVQSSRTRA